MRLPILGKKGPKIRRIVQEEPLTIRPGKDGRKEGLLGPGEAKEPREQFRPQVGDRKGIPSPEKARQTAASERAAVPAGERPV